MEIQEVDAPDALRALREEWEGLVERCPTATIYQTWEWNEAWWRAFGAGKQLRLLLIRDREELLGIAPFYTSRHLKGPLRRLAFIGTGSSDYLDLVAEVDSDEAVANEVLCYLDGTKGFDLADLQQLRPGSLLLEAACAARNDTSLRRPASIIAQEPCPYITLPESWEEYTKRLSKKSRSNLSYNDRLLFKSFPTAEIRKAESRELDSAMDALFDLHQRRWKSRMLPGVLGRKPVREFHRDVARRFQDRGWLRLHMIRIEEKIVASLYCFEYRKRYYYYLGGFAPELGRYSLGTVLTARAIQDAIVRGCEEFDFLRGAEPYKYRWQPDERINHRVLLADGRSVRARAMVTLNRFERYVEHRAKVFAENRGRSGKK